MIRDYTRGVESVLTETRFKDIPPTKPRTLKFSQSMSTLALESKQNVS